jgi:hypothetical protein
VTLESSNFARSFCTFPRCFDLGDDLQIRLVVDLGCLPMAQSSEFNCLAVDSHFCLLAYVKFKCFASPCGGQRAGCCVNGLYRDFDGDDVR